MALRLPFKKWIYDESSCYANQHGGHYYFIPTRGKRVIAAVSIRTIAGGYSYKIHSSFRRKYAAALHLVGPFTWTNRDQFRLWMHAQVHNSFVYTSAPGVGCGWFYAYLSAHDLQGSMTIPIGYRTHLQSVQSPVWILLRLGSKSWAIQVDDDRLRKGWQKFRKTHNLQIGQKIIFGCERRWIFNVIIIDEEEKEAMYTWSFQKNEFWHHPHPPDGNLNTSCLPSVLQNDPPLIITGFWHTAALDYCERLQQMLHPFLIHPAETDLLITMGNQESVIFINNDLNLDRPLVNHFMATLQLGIYDYVLVALLPGLRLRIIVCNWTTSCGRMNDWLAVEH